MLACTSVCLHHSCLKSKEDLVSLELELELVASYHVGAGNYPDPLQEHQIPLPVEQSVSSSLLPFIPEPQIRPDSLGTLEAIRVQFPLFF